MMSSGKSADVRKFGRRRTAGDYTGDMQMKNVFVFPCGSEIALEIERSLRYSTHFNLIGGCSVKDHGRFVFSDLIDNLPWETDSAFIPTIKKIVQERRIDLIFPAMDSSIVRLKEAEKELGCRVVGSPLETTKICLSKKKTYQLLTGKIRVPKLYSIENIMTFPVFCKPEIGYGARGAAKINNFLELKAHMEIHPYSLICEFLPGIEYTVDCFTNRNRKLLFCGPRIRGRIMNGISVNTYPVPVQEKKTFEDLALKINEELSLRGAWFFQVKRDKDDSLCLLEIAVRLGGSSALFRGQGVNFAELTLWDALEHDVSIEYNNYDIEMDRALDNQFKIQIDYNEVFIDFDDTIILQKKYYNLDVVKFLFKCKNNGVKVTLLTKHEGDLQQCLYNCGLTFLFDRVIHLMQNEEKFSHIDNCNSIFIDDSFAERKKISQTCHIPVFGLDMISFL